MDWVLSLVTLAGFVLIGGAIYLWRRQGPGRQVWLMLVLAAVMFANVAIWAIPMEEGAPTPAGSAPSGP